jgi:hypothetical protein
MCSLGRSDSQGQPLLCSSALPGNGNFGLIITLSASCSDVSADEVIPFIHFLSLSQPMPRLALTCPCPISKVMVGQGVEWWITSARSCIFSSHHSVGQRTAAALKSIASFNVISGVDARIQLCPGSVVFSHLKGP